MALHQSLNLSCIRQHCQRKALLLMQAVKGGNHSVHFQAGRLSEELRDMRAQRAVARATANAYREVQLLLLSWTTLLHGHLTDKFDRQFSTGSIGSAVEITHLAACTCT